MGEDLSGKVAVVTGAGSGIGRAVAEGFRDAGMKLVVTGRRAHKLDGFGDGDEIAKVAGDITDPALPGHLLEVALDRFARCDFAVNNAGYMTSGPIADIDIDKVCHMVRVNVEAAYRVAHVFVRHFSAVGEGHLINTSSVLATKVRATAGAYCGTKYAIKALSEALRMELGTTKVKVSCVEPGLVLTELHEDFEVHPKDQLGIDEPLRPADVARAVMFQVSQPDHVLIPRLMILPNGHEI
ncbi:MAG: SDR family oxidoreductase [Alphaproteobacteria bacterium]|jgi:NADP-dependent 3-hydroxy acid dehydrogenase YdfG|nr:SDR family oxidoreductase [Alphaproteobacteria bacterium]MDP6516274.1 SDR family oxidoreductase [Alphaproteobacteria bacterium]